MQRDDRRLRQATSAEARCKALARRRGTIAPRLIRLAVAATAGLPSRRAIIAPVKPTLALLAVLFACAAAHADDIVTLWDTAYVSVRPGTTVRLILLADIAPGYVVVAHQAQADQPIPLTLQVERTAYLTPGSPTYPVAEQGAVEGGTLRVPVYSATLRIALPITVSPQAPAGETMLEGELRYQACNTWRCLPPRTVPVQLVLDIARGAE